MAASNNPGPPRNITHVMVAVIVLAILLIAALTVTAIVGGPPAI